MTSLRAQVSLAPGKHTWGRPCCKPHSPPQTPVFLKKISFQKRLAPNLYCGHPAPSTSANLLPFTSLLTLFSSLLEALGSFCQSVRSPSGQLCIQGSQQEAPSRLKTVNELQVGGQGCPLTPHLLNQGSHSSGLCWPPVIFFLNHTCTCYLGCPGHLIRPGLESTPRNGAPSPTSAQALL